MAKSLVVPGPVKKHARLKGELYYHQQTVKRLEKALESTGESIHLFDPEYRLHKIKPIRPYQRSRYFRHGEMSKQRKSTGFC